MKKLWRFGLGIALGVAVVLAHVDATEAQCAARPVIADLAGRIINGREGLSRIKIRRFSADAAYLLIRYGDLSKAEIADLLDRMIRENVVRGQELKSTYDIANGSADIEEIAGLKNLGWAYQSQWRAVILSDDGERFFDRAQTPLKTSISGYFRKEEWIAFFAARLLRDASDAERARIAATAIRKREIVTALVLLSDQDDLTAFFDLVARYPRHRVLREVRRFPETFTVSFRAQSAPIDLGKDLGRWKNEYRQRSFQLRRVDHRFGDFSFLLNFRNITGKEHFITDAAKGVNEAIDAGWLDPVKRPEQAWISLYRQLIERMGQEAVDAGLGQISRSHAFDPDRRAIRDTIHDAIAKMALRDYAAQQVDDLPKRPLLLSPQTGFDWPAWIRIAKAVREGKENALSETSDALTAIEILFSTGRFDRAIDLTKKTSSQFGALTIYTSMMERLDLTCGAYGWQHGGSFGPLPTIYRFPVAVTHSPRE